MIAHIVYVHNSEDEDNDLTFVELLENEPDYLSLKPHLSENAKNRLREYVKKSGTITFVKIGGSTRINPINGFSLFLADEVARIEKEWDLI